MLPTIKLQLSTYFYATIQYIMSFQMGGTWSVLLFGWSKRWDALLFPFICVRSVLYTEAVLGCIFVFKTSTKGFTSVYSDSLNKVIWILLKIEFFLFKHSCTKGQKQIIFFNLCMHSKGGRSSPVKTTRLQIWWCQLSHFLWWVKFVWLLWTNQPFKTQMETFWKGETFWRCMVFPGQQRYNITHWLASVEVGSFRSELSFTLV